MCVSSLEKIISEAQQDEAEPCRSLLTDDIDVRRCNETKIQKMVGNQNCYCITNVLLVFSKIY